MLQKRKPKEEKRKKTKSKTIRLVYSISRQEGRQWHSLRFIARSAASSCSELANSYPAEWVGVHPGTIDPGDCRARIGSQWDWTSIPGLCITPQKETAHSSLRLPTRFRSTSMMTASSFGSPPGNELSRASPNTRARALRRTSRM